VLGNAAKCEVWWDLLHFIAVFASEIMRTLSWNFS